MFFGTKVGICLPDFSVVASRSATSLYVCLPPVCLASIFFFYWRCEVRGDEFDGTMLTLSFGFVVLRFREEKGDGRF